MFHRGKNSVTQGRRTVLHICIAIIGVLEIDTELMITYSSILLQKGKPYPWPLDMKTILETFTKEDN